MPIRFHSRRTLLKSAVAAGVAPALQQASIAEEAGYAVSAWHGPVAGFSLLDTAGKTWTPADFAGRAVLLNFWASWCEPCRAEMPALQQLAAQHGEAKLLVLAINFKEPAAKAMQFAKTNNVSLPVLLDLDGKAAQRWGVKVFPGSLLIDARGKPRQRVQGEFDWTSAAAGKLLAPLF